MRGGDHEDPDARAASGPRGTDAEGQLTGARRRLRRAIELFRAADGDVYLLGAGGDRVLRGATEADVATLDALAREAHDGRSLGALIGEPAAACERRLADLDAAGLLAPEPACSPLGAEQRERFDRQLIYLEGLGVDAHAAQARLL